MNMLLVTDILLVEVIQVHFLLAMRSSEQLEEVPLEVFAIVVDYFVDACFTHEDRASGVRFGLRMHFEAVLIAHLPLAELAVPAQALQAFGLHFIVELLRRAHFCFRHFSGL